MSNVKVLEVFFRSERVGTLAKAGRDGIAFSYDNEWLKNGFSISPFSLPLKEGVFIAEKPYFGGLYGVFADSLPDAWGRLLTDRMLRQRGIDPGAVSMLDRLSLVGETGRGALTYRPAAFEGENADLDSFQDLDALAAETRRLMRNQEIDGRKLDDLYFAGASSGGARPKIQTRIDGRSWIIKFPAASDPVDIGWIEKCYTDCAASCGIKVPETHLFPSEKCRGYFGARRFDRFWENGVETRTHMLSAAALLELDFTTPSLDYNSLMKLTKILTRGSAEDVQGMYRLMCFNVLAHNRDDHSRNFTFLYDEEKDRWSLSPAYDLTYSSTYFGEQTTSVDGEGRNPGTRQLLAVGKKAGLPAGFCRKTAAEIQEKADRLLEQVQECLPGPRA